MMEKIKNIFMQEEVMPVETTVEPVIESVVVTPESTPEVFTEDVVIPVIVKERVGGGIDTVYL